MPALYTECNNPDINQDVFIPKPRDPTYIEEQRRLGHRDPKENPGTHKTRTFGPLGFRDVGTQGAWGPMDLGIVDPGSLPSKLVLARTASKLCFRQHDVEPELQTCFSVLNKKFLPRMR